MPKISALREYICWIKPKFGFDPSMIGVSIEFTIVWAPPDPFLLLIPSVAIIVGVFISSKNLWNECSLKYRSKRCFNFGRCGTYCCKVLGFFAIQLVTLNWVLFRDELLGVLSLPLLSFQWYYIFFTLNLNYN